MRGFRSRCRRGRAIVHAVRAAGRFRADGQRQCAGRRDLWSRAARWRRWGIALHGDAAAAQRFTDLFSLTPQTRSSSESPEEIEQAPGDSST